MVSFLSRAAQFWSDWGVRVVVLSSFAANAILVLFAGVRRRQASGWGTLLLWLAYQLADLAATYALGNLSLSRGTGVSLREHQLVAFWAPFLLLHLGGPDNISAYSLEDSKLSLRQALHVVMQVMGASYVLYKHVYLGDTGPLFPASALMLALGVAKYVERVCALRRGDLGDIRSSSKKKKKKKQADSTVIGVSRGGQLKLNNEHALLFAHDMFHFCKRAMVDSSVDLDSSSHVTSEKIFTMQWSSMSKVVEMELSLMYDILYTKATVVHTWGGYFIRFVSPLATIIAISLFRSYPKDGQRRADVAITYILLVAAFLLDITWLVRALSSTWTFAFLNARPRDGWLHHAVLRTGRWRRLRRAVVSFDPCRRLLGREPSHYRLWSGTSGRYNLLHECTRGRVDRGMEGLCTMLTTIVGLEDTWNEYKHSRCLFQLPRDVKKLLFERIQRRLPSSSSIHGNPYTMKEITTQWGQVAVKRCRNMFEARNKPPYFGREFQEDILIWHIATCIFLWHGDHQQHINSTYFKAIEALSEYLMFLVAVRRHMLPGLVLPSLLEVTREALDEVWIGHMKNSTSSTSRKEKLAKILREEKRKHPRWGFDKAKSRLVADGTELAISLLKIRRQHMPKLLELIFDVWVDKLLYAGTRCSRESHAKQLSRGGELTTIVWIMAEHAGPFRIGEMYDGEGHEQDPILGSGAADLDYGRCEMMHKPLAAPADGYSETEQVENEDEQWESEEEVLSETEQVENEDEQWESEEEDRPISYATLYPPY
ncbi:hypothetical protein EJB05_47064, partial [Eragrostis curvula]